MERTGFEERTRFSSRERANCSSVTLVRYLDTASRRPDQTLGQWLTDHLHDATDLGCQTAYVSSEGIAFVAPHVEALLNRGGTATVVVGSNDGSVLNSDLTSLLDVLEVGTGRLILAGAADVLIHPKTFYVEQADGSTHAYVGSANLTGRGIDGNVEAGISLSSVDDDPAVLAAIRAAIHAWDGHPNGLSISRADLPALSTEGVTDRPRPPAPSAPPSTSTGSRRRFPGLGRILGRTTPGPAAPGPATPGPVAPGPATPGAAAPAATTATTATSLALPSGAVGVVKELSPLDTKAFHGGTGTPYVAMPSDLAAFLPMSPFGVNQEPRLDIHFEATLDSAPGSVVPHINTRGSTNITWVGAGVTRTSHSDLRLNYLKPIVTGIGAAAATRTPNPHSPLGRAGYRRGGVHQRWAGSPAFRDARP